MDVAAAAVAAAFHGDVAASAKGSRKTHIALACSLRPVAVGMGLPQPKLLTDGAFWVADMFPYVQIPSSPSQHCATISPSQANSRPFVHRHFRRTIQQLTAYDF